MRITTSYVVCPIGMPMVIGSRRISTHWAIISEIGTLMPSSIPKRSSKRINTIAAKKRLPSGTKGPSWPATLASASKSNRLSIDPVGQAATSNSPHC